MNSTMRYLVAPSQLKEMLKHEATVVLDASWFMPNIPRDPYNEYLAKRIPTARFWDVDRIASVSPLGLKHMLPNRALFQKATESLGITPQSNVVVYDTLGVFSAPRTMYTFKALGFDHVSILDGGMPRWIYEGYELETDPNSEGVRLSKELYESLPSVDSDPELYRSEMNKAAVDYGYILSNIKATKEESPFLVLDARSEGRFLGKDPEPRPGLSSGHMPNSASVPFTDVLDSKKSTFLSSDEIANIFKNRLGEDSWNKVKGGELPVVTSCGSGMTAAVLWLALGLADAPFPRLYDESWTGYALRPESKIIKE